MKTEQDWENYHEREDQKIIKKIKRCNIRSTIYMLLGIGSVTGAGNLLGSILKTIAKMSKVKGHLASDDILTHEIIIYSVAFIALLILCVFFFFKAMFRWDEAEKLSEERLHWTPNEEEIEFINNRFDNPFVEYMLSALSPTQTRCVEVGFRSITVHSSRGKASCYYNKHGYEQLTNYGTKQLAYYLAAKAFPEGFTIYQTKMVQAGADRYVNGVTDVGGEPPQKKKRFKRFKRMLIWLAVWLQDFLRLKTNFKMPKEDSMMKPVNNGQIVINKGYTPRPEGLKQL